MSLPPGLYDELVTDSLRGRLAAEPAVLQDLPAEGAAQRLTEELARQLGRILASADEGVGNLHDQLELTNLLLAHVRTSIGNSKEDIDPVSAPAQLLRAVLRRSARRRRGRESDPGRGTQLAGHRDQGRQRQVRKG